MGRLDPGSTKNDEGRVFPFAVLPELAELQAAMGTRKRVRWKRAKSSRLSFVGAAGRSRALARHRRTFARWLGCRTGWGMTSGEPLCGIGSGLGCLVRWP